LINKGFDVSPKNKCHKCANKFAKLRDSTPCYTADADNKHKVTHCYWLLEASPIELLSLVTNNMLSVRDRLEFDRAMLKRCGTGRCYYFLTYSSVVCMNVISK